MSIIYMLFALLFLQYYLLVASIFPFAYGLIPFRNVCNGYATMVDLHLLWKRMVFPFWLNWHERTPSGVENVAEGGI